MPEISVIIPSYNNAPYIGRAIDSILTQSFTDFEIIIDDCSTDNSREVIESYLSKDARIHVIYHEQNKGVSAARNNGIRVATGNYIAILDADDAFLPTRLDCMHKKITENPDIALVHSDIYVITEQEEIIGILKGDASYSRGYVQGEVLRRRGCHLDKPLMKKECIESVGLYDESLMGGEDYDLYHRLTHRYPVDYVQEPLYLYRLHGTNVTKRYRRILMQYKAYLDKSFAADVLGQYSSIKAEAYSHYFIDLTFVWAQECSRSTLPLIINEGACIFKAYCHHLPVALIPFIRVGYRRIKQKIQKSWAKKTGKMFIQIGW
jgi:glycosyltransferase involved in cell wall biosynthesis